MHKIYFEKRCIVICPPDDQALSDPNCVEMHLGGSEGVHPLVDMFERSGSLQKVYIPTEDPDGTYRMICAEFREVNAAGGLVSNRRGDCLLICSDGVSETVPRKDIRRPGRISASQPCARSGKRRAWTISRSVRSSA